MVAIVVHGGAGRDWPEDERAGAVEGVAQAAAAGWRLMEEGGSALDAVCAAVVALEDDPHFNAGTGSVLNEAGEVEMDASVMAGDRLACGAVAGIREVRNPVLVARRVMEATDCVLLAADAATAFAREQGYGSWDPVIAQRRAQWRQALARGAQRAGEGDAPGTVGAVALDRAGRLAAATSTGGREMKRRGRIGDSAIPGAGNYADTHAAVSATGWGELMLRAVSAKAIAERIARGAAPREAVSDVLADMMRRFGVPIGVICLDAQGRVAVEHGTAAMPHAFRRAHDAAVVARYRAAQAG